MARRFGPVLAVGALLLVASCTPADPAPNPSPDRAALSQKVIDDAVTAADGPGCAAAVGHQGAVVWQGAKGVADVETGTPITEATVFDIGSVTKQFTATMILLLVADGGLALDDAVSDHVDGLPAWAGDVTIDQLIHHVSGIPDYIPLLIAEGYPLEGPAERDLALQTIVGVTRLNAVPGTRHEYSNSNYILLGYVIEKVAGAPLADVLADRIFRPLDLGMIMEPTGPVTGKARSYRTAASGSGYEVADWHWDAAGAAGIQSRLADLVAWGDNYRTGNVGGRQLLDLQLAGAVDTGEGEGTQYGAGIFIEEGALFHLGEYGGFHALLGISADREQAIAVACNLSEIDVNATAVEIAELWDF